MARNGHDLRFWDPRISVRRQRSYDWLILSDVFRKFRKIWTPDPFPIRGAVWDPVDSPMGFNYLSIDVNPEMKNFYHFGAVKFWNSIVPAIKNAEQISPFGQRRPFQNPFDRRGGRGNVLSNGDLSNSDISNQAKSRTNGAKSFRKRIAEKFWPRWDRFGRRGRFDDRGWNNRNCSDAPAQTTAVPADGEIRRRQKEQK